MSRTPSKYPDTLEQTEWLNRTRQGDRAAFSHIVDKYQRPVYNLCYHMLRNPHDAEDAAQEVFLRVYARLDSYDPQRQFSTWLFAIASHYCIDRLKRPRMLVAWDDVVNWYDGSDDQDSVHPERALAQTETAREAQNLLQTLRPDYRTVVILKYWHTMSYEEIAETLQTTVSVIKSKLFRARRMMAQAATRRQPTRLAPALAMPA
jgi:RNA polymerase sigma-70 factor, ECF subfamily